MPSDPDLLFDGPADASATVVLAHGAGAAMDTPFMNFFAAGLADRGNRVVRFEFPYKASKRRTGKGKPPDRELVLWAMWLRVVEMVRAWGKTSSTRPPLAALLRGKPAEWNSPKSRRTWGTVDLDDK